VFKLFIFTVVKHLAFIVWSRFTLILFRRQ